MHYVERSAKILVINAPTMFTLVWKVVSPWINENTRQKVKILGSDYKKEMLKVNDCSSIVVVVVVVVLVLPTGPRFTFCDLVIDTW